MAHRRLSAMGDRHPLASKAIAACIGEGVATEFMAYTRLKDELPDVSAILEDGRAAPVPPANRPDRRYYIVSALATELFRKASLPRVREGMRYVMRMEADLGARFLRDLMVTRSGARSHVLAVLQSENLGFEGANGWREVVGLVRAAVK